MPSPEPAAASVHTLPDGTVVARFPGEPGTGLVHRSGAARPLAGWLQVTVAPGAATGRLITVAGRTGVLADLPVHGWTEHRAAAEAACEVHSDAGRLRVVLTLAQLARLQVAVTAAGQRAAR